MRRRILLLSVLLLLGAGCAQAPAAPADDTPNGNKDNCERSGGAIDAEGFCLCPDGYAPDPADFCLDAQGAPGGAMKP
jgi:hypothetical protein